MRGGRCLRSHGTAEHHEINHGADIDIQQCLTVWYAIGILVCPNGNPNETGMPATTSSSCPTGQGTAVAPLRPGLLGIPLRLHVWSVTGIIGVSRRQTKRDEQAGFVWSTGGSGVAPLVSPERPTGGDKAQNLRAMVSPGRPTGSVR